MMNHFMDGFKFEQAHVEYCCYCFSVRGDQRSCCSENHFVEFRDLDDDTQQRIAQEEYEWNNHKDQK
jgi:hypothetical protein